MEVYFHWFDSGIAADSKCIICEKKISEKKFAEHKGCISCRRDFANLNLINSKIMEEILYTKDRVMDILNNYLQKNMIKDKTVSFSDILGYCLATSFPEKIGNISDKKKNRITFKYNEDPCKVCETSVFFDKLISNKNTKVIAMKITKLPNGKMLADQIHPLKEDWNLKNKKINYEQKSMNPKTIPKKNNEEVSSDLFIVEKFNDNIDEILSLPKNTQKMILDDFLCQILHKHMKDKSLINIIADRINQFYQLEIDDIIQYTKNNSAMLQKIREAEEWIHNL